MKFELEHSNKNIINIDTSDSSNISNDEIPIEMKDLKTNKVTATIVTNKEQDEQLPYHSRMNNSI